MSEQPHTSKGPLPPTLFLASLVVQVALHIVFPAVWVFPGVWRWLGLAPLAAGLWVSVVAEAHFKRERTAVNPFQEPSALVTTGPFRYSRNPMYLGLIVIQLGIAMLLGSLTPLLVPPVFAWLLTHRFIRMEEAKMERLFGEPYLEYRGQVRRWL